MLAVVTAIKLVAEIALLAFAGQWLLGLLAGKRRDSNLFYRLLQVLTTPFVRAARLITPRLVLDQHLDFRSELFDHRAEELFRHVNREFFERLQLFAVFARARDDARPRDLKLKPFATHRLHEDGEVQFAAS